MSSLRVHVLQHAESTPPGSVLDWLKAKGHAATLVRLYNGDSLPTVDETDWLILLGGEMNVDDTTEFPFLADEKKLIKQALDKKKTCLGLCLGGQLLAQSLGAQVRKNSEWEAGWHTVHFGNIAGPDSRLMTFSMASRHVRPSERRRSRRDQPRDREPGLRVRRPRRRPAIPPRSDRRVDQIKNRRRQSFARRRARSNARAD